MEQLRNKVILTNDQIFGKKKAMAFSYRNQHHTRYHHVKFGGILKEPKIGI